MLMSRHRFEFLSGLSDRLLAFLGGSGGGLRRPFSSFLLSLSFLPFFLSSFLPFSFSLLPPSIPFSSLFPFLSTFHRLFSFCLSFVDGFDFLLQPG